MLFRLTLGYLSVWYIYTCIYMIKCAVFKLDSNSNTVWRWHFSEKNFTREIHSDCLLSIQLEYFVFSFYQFFFLHSVDVSVVGVILLICSTNKPKKKNNKKSESCKCECDCILYCTVLSIQSSFVQCIRILEVLLSKGARDHWREKHYVAGKRE